MISVRTLVALGACLALAACVVRVRQVNIEPVLPAASGTTIHTPVKAHLLDGSTVVFRQGIAIDADSLRGFGMRYGLRLEQVGSVTRVPLDSVAGLESYRTGTNVPASLALSVPATAIGGFGTLVVLKAIFGSCPTIYTDSAGTQVLEAESFSYSIAPMLENRDVDRLSARADAAGEVVLEIRNEALETHYINHLELLVVGHSAAELVVPHTSSRPLAVRGLSAPLAARDRSGRDQRGLLTESDGEVYESPPQLLAQARADDLRDHIDLVFARPAADSAAIVFRVRNSLLTTILFYDVMLAAQGARALDWLGVDMQEIGSVLELGQWYNRHMGVRVAVLDDGEYRDVARVGDSGPIAWKDVAAVVPVPASDDSLRVRLSFVADSWRIDRVAVAGAYRWPDVRTVQPNRIRNADGNDEPQALLNVRDADERYLHTTPGQSFKIRFDVGTDRPGQPRTFLIASQGYYTEWVRPSWIRAALEPAPFRPSDELLLSAIERWRTQREPFEAEFYSSKIPVR